MVLRGVRNACCSLVAKMDKNAATMLCVIALVYISGLPAVVSMNSTGEYCPPGCDCSTPSSAVVCNANLIENEETPTELSFYGLDLEEVPAFEGEYAEVEVIDLEGNRITVVHTGQFRRENFPVLHTIVLRDNLIFDVNRNAFRIPSLVYLDLSRNDLNFFDVGTFIEHVDERFLFLDLGENHIEMMAGPNDLDPAVFPDLSINLAGNNPPCSAWFLPPLCPFLTDDGSTCSNRDGGAVPLVPDFCNMVSPPMEDGDEEDSNSDASSPQTPPPPPNNADGQGNSGADSSTSSGGEDQLPLIIGSVFGGGVILFAVVFLVVLLLVCIKFKMWAKRLDVQAGEAGTRTCSFGQLSHPPGLAPSAPSLHQPSTRYVFPPHAQPPPYSAAFSYPLSKYPTSTKLEEDTESIYEDIDDNRPLPDLPPPEMQEADYETNGYILRVATIPPKKFPPVVKQVSVELETPSKAEADVEPPNMDTDNCKVEESNLEGSIPEETEVNVDEMDEQQETYLQVVQ